MHILERLHKLQHEIRKAIPKGPRVNNVIRKLLTCSVYLQTKSIFNVPASVEDTCSGLSKNKIKIIV